MATIVVTTFAFVAAIGGCRHVGREVDLVSKLGLEKTDRIVVGVEEAFTYNPAAIDISNKNVIDSILSDLRKAKGVRSLKYGTVGSAKFVTAKGNESELEIYGGMKGTVVRVQGRYYEFGGKLVEMIRNYRAGDSPGAEATK